MDRGQAPGFAFGENDHGHVRGCYATAYVQVFEACDRIDRFVQGLRKSAPR